MLRRLLLVAALFALSVPLATRSASLPIHPAAGPSVDWPSFNNDVQSDRYANIALITPANASHLHIVCTATLGGPAALETGPIVVGGVLYATRANQTFAFDAATCAPRWTNTYATSNLTQQSRGLAYADGRLFRGFADGHVIAIDASSGATVWDKQVIAAGSYESISAAPVTYAGMLIVGTSNGETPQVCHVFGLLQSTGATAWSQQTVPAASNAAVKTWGGATVISGGSMWTSFTVDPATGRLYVPVGNPEADFDTRQRLGSNLYTDSVLVFDALKGTFEAGLQLVPGDDHDWDQAAAPALATLGNGKIVALIAGKDGYLSSYDLRSGSLYWKAAVTTIANSTAPITLKGTHYCPWAGVLWNGAAYSPGTGLTYVNATDWCSTLQLAATPQPAVPGRVWTGSANGFGTRDASNSGWLQAFNAITGVVSWKYHASRPLLAGVTPTAGGVVFTGDLLGNVLAFNAASGALLTTVATNMPIGGGVISYEVSGTQYVAVAAGLTSRAFNTASTGTSIVILGL